MEKKTPLYDEHVKLSGKIVPFAGYLLPVQYPAGVIAEHMAVRSAAGLFDVSHMGEITFKGPDALKNLNMILTNSFDDMKDGRARYSVMCNENGGCVDDLLVYKRGEGDYLVVVNASNKDKDFEWMKSRVSGDCAIDDISDTIAQIALQGPLSEEILKGLTDEACIPKGYYTAVFDAVIDGMDVIISRTGYTGEDGFEFYVKNDDAVRLWNTLLEAGKDKGLIPCGLGARDTLRMEAAMPLYGHEMDDEITPIETGLSFVVKTDKADFIGKKALEEKGAPTRTRVGLEVTGKGIVREHMDIYAEGEVIGHTTSGTHCPYIGKAIAMALIDKGYAAPGTVLTADVRGRQVEVTVTELPFYKKGGKK